MVKDNEYIAVQTSDVLGDIIDIKTIGTITLSGDENQYYVHNDLNWNLSDICWSDVEWQECFPAHSTVKDMCKEYPALEKAYENFKTVYKMVEQDWIGKQKEKYSST